MEKQRVLFFRNIFLRALVTGIALAILYAILTLSFWDIWLWLMTNMFDMDEKDSVRMIVGSLINIRVILLFFILVPAIALHWTASRMK